MEVSFFMSRAKNIAYIAILTAIGVVVNILTLPPFSVFGRISIVYAFCFLCGIILGPFYGAMTALFADLLQVTIQGMWGTFVPQVTISNMLIAIFMGIIYHKVSIKLLSVKLAIVGLLTLVFCSCGLSAWGEAMILFDIYPYTMAKTLGSVLNIESKYLMIALSKLITQSFWIILNIGLTLLIYPALQKAKLCKESYYVRAIKLERVIME